MAAHVKDMALTRADFSRSIAVLLAGEVYDEDARGVVYGPPERQVTIALQDLPPRVLSPLIKLERHQVTVTFAGYEPAAEADFMARFDRVFQRGGG